MARPSLNALALLQTRLARHNRAALGWAVGSLAASVVAWTLLYVVSQWLALLGLSAIVGGDARLPHGFSLGCAVIAAALMTAAWLDRVVLPPSLPRDELIFREVAIDLLLVVPRMTLAIRDNWRARQILRPPEVLLGADLVEKLADGRVPLHAVPVEIPEERSRDRVLFALLITETAVLREEAGVQFLQLSAPVKKCLRGATLS